MSFFNDLVGVGTLVRTYFRSGYPLGACRKYHFQIGRCPKIVYNNRSSLRDKKYCNFFLLSFLFLFVELGHRRFSPSRPFPHKGHRYSRVRPREFFIFLPKNLHISKISSTFAAAKVLIPPFPSLTDVKQKDIEI